MRLLAILCVKNEGAFLLEWLAHHLACGVSEVLAFSNDCADGTDAMLERLQQMGLVQHRPNPGPYDRRGIQFTALNAAAQHPALARADWILPLDIDEFVNVHIGDHTLPALIAALPEATAITLTWRLFGNAGVQRYADRPVTETFRRAAPRRLPWPWRAAMFKTLYRNDGTYAKPGIHRPRAPDPARLEGARWFDGQGRRLPDLYRSERIFSPFGRDNHALVQLNHYALGAMESYLLKSDRGRAVHARDQLGLDYWSERNFNQEEDRSIDALAPARAQQLARLRADPELARLHSAAVAWRQARFDQLMRQEPARALFARLLMTPPSRALSPAEARFLFSQARPEAVSRPG
ncbi:glycosyltransferase family 2 protein [Pseudooceanicola sp. CBS1P-1]|uniref:Glycosyltransferase family 2 protein n=1 Tax=Pseudooceanicola albus TaxID=2692189 RepID=A0A6L7G355_9RHOB|nr:MULTISPECIES: glycosyltransferase family 2 protein [Pseudooceanicola]MBT9382482.1 glycosyltransferase family 2 protein [Pseudooceanicola endophyticus]MXN17023.1 glycosyltransferase family 2 protein [Pseudooceanicola albus]